MNHVLTALALLGLLCASPAAAQQQRAPRDDRVADSGAVATDSVAGPASAADSAAVRAAIGRLFEAMRAADSAAVRAAFAPRARLMTVATEDDSTATVRATSVDRFAAVVGAAREATWDERVWGIKIRRDGPLAAAWVPYAFYVDDQMSHCGTNAIQLARLGEASGNASGGAEGNERRGTARAWQIVQLTDTRREDCAAFVPEAVQSGSTP